MTHNIQNTTDYKGRDSEYWRGYLLEGVHNPETSRKFSDFIMSNTLRYNLESKELSLDGYNALMQNWDVIKNNCSYSEGQIYKAERFFRKEQKRLEQKVWEESSGSDDQYEIPKLGFFQRLKLKWGFA